MKKRYFMAVLLLLGLGVVVTMAFSLGSATTSVPVVFSIEQSSTTDHVTSIKVLPWKNADGIYFIIVVESSDTITLSFDLFDDDDTDDGLFDLSSAQVYTRIEGEAWSTASSVTGNDGHFEISESGTDFTKLYVKITQAGIYTSVDSILVGEVSWS